MTCVETKPAIKKRSSMKMSADGVGYVGKADSIAQAPVAPQHALLLKDGQIIIAFIEKLEGNILKLRTEDGKLISALMQGDLGLMQGDVVEAIAGKSSEHTMLYILNVSHETPPAAAESTTQQASPSVLSDMMSTLKRNSGIDADTAMFLVENRIPGTAENVSALTQMVKGESIGALLGQILGSVMQADEPAQHSAMAVDTAPTQEGPVNGSAEPQGMTAERQPTAVMPQPDIQNDLTGEKPRMDGAAVPAKGEEKSVEASPESRTVSAPVAENTALPKNAAPRVGEPAGQPLPALPQNPGTTPVKADAVAPSYTLPAEMPEVSAKVETLASAEIPADTEASAESRIAEAIRNMTVRPEPYAGADLKKIAREMPRAMSTLKSLLVQSDMKDKEGYLKRIDQTLRQMEMADRTLRFEHMQLPVTDRAGEYRTAELYVFRNRSGRRDAGEAGVAILVALDTRHIGRTETLIRESEGSISLEFRLERADAAEIFKGQTGALAQAVEAAGYRLTGVRFTGLERRTTVVNAGEAAGMDTGKAPHGVDVRI
jgi:hypothetical protein